MHATSGAPVVVGVGEALLRLDAPVAERLERTRSLSVHVGGAELNALVLLRHLGCHARWVSRLPDNQLGRLVLSYARGEGVEPVVTWSARRQGLYFLEPGVPPRAPEILYDRANSAASELGLEHVPVDEIVSGADLFYSTGITLGIGASPRQFVTSAYRRARDLGVSTSLDINYRSKLWGREDARAVISPLLDDVDVLFASPFDLTDLLGAGSDPSTAATRIRDEHGCRSVVIPERRQHTDGSAEIGVRVIGDEEDFSGVVSVRPSESIGVGDAIAAGFLSGWLQGDTPLGARRAAVAGAMKATIRGDALAATQDELDREIDPSNRVIR